MKQLLPKILIIVFAMFTTFHLYAQGVFCKSNGNVIIYSNYDGGYLNINVDENIPNLKIGITTYENCEIAISGAYASNVTEVFYAGYQGTNQHCNPSPLATTVNGVPVNIVTILQFPPATWTNPYGYPYIICNYQCDSAGYQGGCNTPDQISHYYLTQFGGSLYYHFTQYGCWSGTYNISDGGNCCIGADILPPQFSIVADFTASDDSVCAEEGIFFDNTSFNSYPGSSQYNWDFGDGSPDVTTTDASHGYSLFGNYTVTLTITDSSGVATDTQTMVITVLHCGATGIFQLDAPDLISIQPNPAHNELIFGLPSAITFPVSAELIDGTGKSRLIKQLDSPGEGNKKLMLGVRDLPSGLYLLKISSENYNGSGKIMIE